MIMLQKKNNNNATKSLGQCLKLNLCKRLCVAQLCNVNSFVTSRKAGQQVALVFLCVKGTFVEDICPYLGGG